MSYRDFTLVGARPHTTQSGRLTLLAVWERPCRTCGARFEVLTPAAVAWAARTASAAELERRCGNFGHARCPTCRPAPSPAQQAAREKAGAERRAATRQRAAEELWYGREAVQVLWDLWYGRPAT